jgi:hypothetical protein
VFLEIRSTKLGERAGSLLEPFASYLGFPVALSLQHVIYTQPLLGLKSFAQTTDSSFSIWRPEGKLADLPRDQRRCILSFALHTLLLVKWRVRLNLGLLRLAKQGTSISLKSLG